MTSRNQSCNVTAAEAFILWHDKVLIAKRSNQEDFLAGYWELIGGRVEEGESIKQACIREVKEESGLHVKTLRSYHEYSYAVPDGRYVCGTVFFCKLQQKPKVILSKEHQEYTWISVNELQSIKPMTNEMCNRIKKGFLEATKENIP